MQRWPTTQNTLLVKLAGAEFESVWMEFSDQYEPLIYRFGRKRGLQHADAIELTQQVMLGVIKSAEKWARDKPPEHFRGWLKRVASNQLINVVTREAKHRGQGGSAQQSIKQAMDTADPADQQAEKLWETEQQRAILRTAASNIRDEFASDSWIAFERTLLGGETVENLASELGKSAGAIYAARARIMRRLKQEAKRLQGMRQ